MSQMRLWEGAGGLKSIGELLYVYKKLESRLVVMGMRTGKIRSVNICQC